MSQEVTQYEIERGRSRSRLAWIVVATLVSAGRRQARGGGASDLGPGISAVPGPELDTAPFSSREEVQLAVVVPIAGVHGQVEAGCSGGRNLQATAKCLGYPIVDPGPDARVVARREVRDAVLVEIAERQT